MWIYLLLVFVILLLIIVSIIYIFKLSHRIIKNYISNKFSIILSFITIILLIIGLFIDPINAIVVDMHLILLTILVKIMFFIIKRLIKKEYSEYFIISISIIISILILIPAYHRAYDVKQTKYSVYTEKDIGIDSFRIVQISDSHIGTTISGKKLGKYVEEINELNPSIVVITGDYIDDYTSYTDLVDASNSLGDLKTKYGVYFIFGNHDKGYYTNKDYNYNDLKDELTKNKVIILEDEIVELTENLVLIGRKDRGDLERENILELTKNIDKNKYLIVLNHQPNDYENEIKSEVDLVLSGHTHGGHIFPFGELGVLLGANDKVYGMEKRNNTTFIVNSGISGWAIKFRTRSIAEYGIIDIMENDSNVK